MLSFVRSLLLFLGVCCELSIFVAPEETTVLQPQTKERLSALTKIHDDHVNQLLHLFENRDGLTHGELQEVEGVVRKLKTIGHEVGEFVESGMKCMDTTPRHKRKRRTQIDKTWMRRLRSANRRTGFLMGVLGSPSAKDNADQQNGTLSKWLWDQSQDLIQESLNTDFIQGMKNGTLDVTEYGAYMLQDMVYCDEAGISYGITANKSTAADIKNLASSRQQLYEKIVRHMKIDWHISDLHGINVGFAAKNYSAWERLVAETMAPIYTMVVNIPCERLWPWMAQQIQSYATPDNIYSFWIEDNKDSSGYRHVEDIVDKYAATVDPTTALKVYRASLQGEIDFFNSATKSY